MSYSVLAVIAFYLQLQLFQPVSSGPLFGMLNDLSESDESTDHVSIRVKLSE